MNIRNLVKMISNNMCIKAISCMFFFSPLLANAEVLTRIIDTGAGHASITKMSDGHYMVFDAGRRSASNIITSQMKEVMGEDRIIDLLVISHTDADHLGAVPAIFNEFEVRMVIRAGFYRCNRAKGCQWLESQDAVRNAVFEGKTIDLNLRRYPIGHGYTFNFGETNIQLISGFHTPPESWGINPVSEASDYRNAGSVVVRLEYDGKSILFTGDEWGKNPGPHSPIAGAEKYMVENIDKRPIKSDVLIAAHHGADDASSSDFLTTVNPSWVILPAGGSHQHPRMNTVQRILDRGIEEGRILRTDLCDKPGPKEWRGNWVPGADDDKGDDHIDIFLSEGQPVKVSYVHGEASCTR